MPHRHLHVLLVFSSKKDIRDAAYFDFSFQEQTYHAHIEPVKSLADCRRYVCKDGQFICGELLDCSTSTNFIKRQKDHEAWSRHCAPRRPQPPPGLTIGTFTLSFDPALKKRNLWVVGEPDCGKTYTFSHRLCEYDVYWVPTDTKYPFEGYNDQNLILYDDSFPSFQCIADVCNTHLHQKHVYGPVRFVEKYWKLEQTRTIIVLSNNYPEYGRAQEAFLARFQVVHWRQLFPQ